MKRIIQQATWERREHFEFFKSFEHPHFDVTAPLEVTAAVAHARQARESFFKLVLFLGMKAIHAVPEFRVRMEGDDVVEFDRLAVAPTYMPKSRPGLYGNMLVEYDEEFSVFSARLAAAMEAQERQPSMQGAGNRLDVVYASCIPWLAYTSLTNPVCCVRADSVPRFSWGKYTEENGRLIMPCTIQLHHGLADAFHAAQFYERLQQFLHEPACGL